MASPEISKDLSLEVHKLFREARAANAKMEMRAEPRYPFFHPVKISVGKFCLSAFSRDVSERGIGLLHYSDFPEPGEVTITISTAEGYRVQVRTRILWCKPCGEGWYVSGGEFVGISSVGK